jgi:phosphotransferase system HPr-like phosphotransfer protein
MLNRGFRSLAQARDIEAARQKVNDLEAQMQQLATSSPNIVARFGAGIEQKLEDARATLHKLLTEQQQAAFVIDDRPPPPRIGGGETQADKDRAKELEKIKEHEHAKVQAFIEGLQMREDARIAANMSESELERERYVLEQEQLLEALEQKMITLAEYQQLELEGLMNHREAMAHIEMDYLDRIAEAERRSADERMALQKRVADFNVSVQQDQNNRIISLLSTLGARNKGFALAAIALQTATAFKQNKIATALAANLAFASQIIPGDPSSLARAAAARAYAFSQGAVTGGLILAAGAVQAAGALGGGTTAGAAASAGVSSGGLSAPSSSVSAGSVGSVMANGANRGQQVTIQLQGETFGRDAVRNLISEINEAISDGAVLRLA